MADQEAPVKLYFMGSCISCEDTRVWKLQKWAGGGSVFSVAGSFPENSYLKLRQTLDTKQGNCASQQLVCPTGVGEAEQFPGRWVEQFSRHCWWVQVDPREFQVSAGHTSDTTVQPVPPRAFHRHTCSFRNTSWPKPPTPMDSVWVLCL